MKESGNFLHAFDNPTITYKELVCQVVNDLIREDKKVDKILERELTALGELQYKDFIKKEHLERKEFLDKLEEILRLMVENYSLEYVL